MGATGQARARVALIDSRSGKLEVKNEIKVVVSVGVLDVAPAMRLGAITL